MALGDIVGRLAQTGTRRAEATIQADVRQLLLDAPLDLESDDIRDVSLESGVGDGRRIDVELGATAIEVKRELREGSSTDKARKQLAGYVSARQEQTGNRYVGILTDGRHWRCYHLRGEDLVEVTRTKLRGTPEDVRRICDWLDGVLATAQDVTPTPKEIRTRLGQESSSYALDRAALSALYAEYGAQPTVQMKRQLWARLLTTALGTQFTDDDDLFIEHTLLVNSAEIIAHAVLGLSVATQNPASLLSGAKFEEASVFGVVEADFFDWVIEVPGGDVYVRALARRLSRFSWADIDHDVLKVLYESVIGPETRKRLGEYYTPDWLAEAVLEAAVPDPLGAKVLDPACGSGTFLFHSIRRYLHASESAGTGLAESLRALVTHVRGMDLHPVAVTLARVTYILAIGHGRLTDPSRPAVRVPVYLGDSLQWGNEERNLLGQGHLVVRTEDDAELFASELRFPDGLLQDDQRFDELVQELATKAGLREAGSAAPSLSSVFKRLAIAEEFRPTIEATFKTMCRLHDEGRDHIWGYYVRNLARPMWLSQEGNRVDIVVGNPPWLAYRHMTEEMQATFKAMSKSRRLWQGAKVATHQDLATLFVARSVQLYLKPGGHFAMVVPNAVVDREHYGGFREAFYPDATEPVRVRFSEPWDLRRIRPHIFPRGAAVVFGQRSGESTVMPARAEYWSGRQVQSSASWTANSALVSRVAEEIPVFNEEYLSVYRGRFTQGSICVPRVLFTVVEKPATKLGVKRGHVAITSRRSAYEKLPWKEVGDLEGVVESEFVRPLLVGEGVLPFRLRSAQLIVVPWDGKRILAGNMERIDLYPGLASWWRQAEGVWESGRKKKDKPLSLVEQLDYRGKFTAQFPLPSLRVVYGSSGMHICAAKTARARAVIDSSLYWATAGSEAEADYLCAILNTACVTELVRPLMSYGKDERHVHKHVWKLPIPPYDPERPDLARIAAIGASLTQDVAALDVAEDRRFTAARRDVRGFIADSTDGQELDECVRELLG